MRVCLKDNYENEMTVQNTSKRASNLFYNNKSLILKTNNKIFFKSRIIILVNYNHELFSGCCCVISFTLL
jgi:hypothetical protein